MSWDYDDEMHEYEFGKKDYVKFESVQYNAKGEKVAHVQRYVRGDDTEYLPNLLREFHYFLQGLTYSYVTGISAYKADGEDVASSEEF